MRRWQTRRLAWKLEILVRKMFCLQKHTVLASIARYSKGISGLWEELDELEKLAPRLTEYLELWQEKAKEEAQESSERTQRAMLAEE